MPGRLPWLAGLEADISKRPLRTAQRPPSELDSISKPRHQLKERAAEAGRRQVSDVLFHFGSREFCLCGGWGEALCGLGAPACVLQEACDVLPSC